MAQFVVFLLFLMLVLLRAALRKEIPAIASEYWESVGSALLLGIGAARARWDKRGLQMRRRARWVQAVVQADVFVSALPVSVTGN